MPQHSDLLTAVSGFGSVRDVPRLPDGFLDVFESWRVDTGRVRLHAVIGGSGAPLLLHCGWPQNWFAWRELMLPLSRHFTVIAVDPRGLGLSDRPADGFDVDTLAGDMFALMDVLGHERFSMVGHDIGVMVGYAMAASRPERIARMALGEGTIPGASPSPELIPDDRWTSDFLWHFNFNRAIGINERLVEGREDIFFNHQFETKAASRDAIPEHARAFYIEVLRRVPGTLRASFDYYRAIDETIPQIRRHMRARHPVPVLAFAGALACGPMVEIEQRRLAEMVEAFIVPGSGHFPAEEKPEILLPALTGFLTA